MHYNQPFNNTATVFNNGYAYSYNHAYNPPPVGFYPQSVIGEGDVSCVALPDGTCQFYFTPTANWCAPSNSPGHNMINTNNFNPYWNPNMGAWFVRSITSPIPAIGQRHEAPIPFHSLDCNMVIDNGYQIKFHNDMWTSTTDIHYFYPCLRQIDYTVELPSRGCAAVQVDTPMVTNTIFRQEVVCSKPCHCTSCPAPDTKPSEDMDCQCTSTSRLIRTVNTNSLQRLHLLPTDVRKKRIRLERKTRRGVKSNDTICECDQPPSLDRKIQNTIEIKPNEPVCRFRPQPDLGKKTDGDFKRKNKDIICECDQPPSLELKKQNAMKIKSKDTDCRFNPYTDLEKKTDKDAKSKNNDVICKCDEPLSLARKKEKAIEINSKEAVCGFKPLPVKNVTSKNNDEICECDQPLTLDKKKQNTTEMKTKDTVCEFNSRPDLKRKADNKNNDIICECDLRSNSQNTMEIKSKNPMCQYNPQPDLEDEAQKVLCCQCCRDKTLSVEKSVTTHDACKASGGDIDKNVQCPYLDLERPAIRGEVFVRIQPEAWCPATESVQKVFNYEKDASETTCCSRFCSGKMLDKKRK